MNKAKFYKDDGKGGLLCAAVGIVQSLSAPVTTRTITLARAEFVMARMGFKRRARLPAALRRRIPRGGLRGERNLSKIKAGMGY